MQPVTLLWVDLTHSVRQAELPPTVSQACEVRVCSSPTKIAAELASGDISAVCFDMDYPNYSVLDLLRKTKLAHPQVPILMLTLQHSESLAVWAFRSRVFDYFVKPVPRLEFIRSLKRLAAMEKQHGRQPGRNILGEPPAIPIETPHMPSTDEAMLMPALTFVEQRYRYKVRNSDVAKLCDMSPFRFSRAFRESFGMTFQEYVMRYRVTESVRLLRNPNANVTDVAYATGFNDSSYFSRMFKRYINMAPTEFVRQNSDTRVSIRNLTGPGQLLQMPMPGGAPLEASHDDFVDSPISQNTGDTQNSWS